MSKQERMIISLIGVVIGATFFIFGGLWLFEGSFILTVKNYSTFLSFFLTTIIALITFLYYLATKNIADKTSESVEATREMIRVTIEPQEGRRKSIATHLLFEVRDNNYVLDYTDYFFEKMLTKLRDLQKESDIQCENINLFSEKMDNTIYKIYLNNSYEIDFKIPGMIALLRNYYSYINDLHESVMTYNELKSLASSRLSYIDLHYLSMFCRNIKGIIKSIKEEELNIKLLESLQIEADYNLQENNALKEFNIGQQSLIDALVERNEK